MAGERGDAGARPSQPMVEMKHAVYDDDASVGGGGAGGGVWPQYELPSGRRRGVVVAMAVLAALAALAGGALYLVGRAQSEHTQEVKYCVIEEAELVASPYEHARREHGVEYSHAEVVRARQGAIDLVNRWKRVLHALAVDAGPLDLSAADRAYYAECMASEDFFRMYADPMCTYLWAKVIRRGEVVAIDGPMEPAMAPMMESLGVDTFKSTENGGVPVRLEDGSRAWFKPCYGSVPRDRYKWKHDDEGENFRGELYTFWLDRLLGINRAPVTAVRTLDVAALRDLVAAIEDEELRRHNTGALESLVTYCSVEDGRRLEGAMIAWAPFPVRTVLKHDLDGLIDYRIMEREDVPPEYASLTQRSPATDKRVPLETQTLELFMHMIDNRRKIFHNVVLAQRRVPIDFDGAEGDGGAEDLGVGEDGERGAGHAAAMARAGDDTDAYADTNDGPVTLLDNDRAQFASTSTHTYQCSTKGGTSAFIDICRFPRSVGLRVLALGFNATSARAALARQEGRPLDKEEYPQTMPPCTLYTPERLQDQCPLGAHAPADATTPVYASAASLGSMLKGLAHAAAPGGMLKSGRILDCREPYVADLRLQYWYNMLSRCIAKQGEEAVLIEEPWERNYDAEMDAVLSRL